MPFVQAVALPDVKLSTTLDKGDLGSQRRNVEKARRSELTAIVDRWHALLPSSWSLTRDVPAQITGFAAGILEFCDRSQSRRRCRGHGSLRRVSEAAGIDELRGIEGAAAAEYFRGVGVMVRPPFVFERRSQHPAHNEVNSLLNLGYTLLANEVASRLESAGFDPRIGYYHGVRYGRLSLALDLMEIHRVSVIDRLTLSVLNRRMFGLEDFEVRGTAGVRMTTPALRRYLALYEGAMGDLLPNEGSVRTKIQRQVDDLRRRVMDGGAVEMPETPME